MTTAPASGHGLSRATPRRLRAPASPRLNHHFTEDVKTHHPTAATATRGTRVRSQDQAA